MSLRGNYLSATKDTAPLYLRGMLVKLKKECAHTGVDYRALKHEVTLPLTKVPKDKLRLFHNRGPFGEVLDCRFDDDKKIYHTRVSYQLVDIEAWLDKNGF